MAALKFASSHNMVAFLDKPTESDGFEQIVDFLNTRPIKYALTVNPTIYTSCIEQFWTTAKVKTVNGEVQIQTLVDKKKVIITETSIRSDLQLEDAEEPMADETTNVESVPIHSNDPLLSGEDRLKLNELMELCMKLSERVLALETTKTNPALEIDSLKRRGRKIADIDADAEVTLVDETQGRNDEEITTTTTIDELTLAQTLIEIKAVKPKVVTTAATTTTTVVTRPKVRRVVVQEPSEFTTTTSPSQPSQLSQVKDKGKAKMVEPENPLKKKDQIMFDKEVAQKLQAQLDAELEEKEKLAKQREEDTNIVEWDNVQAMMDADYKLAARI
ncbi:hypothetical protein Tco_0407499 [Tanacetum coccineum]